MYYAQLDENGRVHTIQESSERINSPRAVQIDENDISLIGAYYNVSNGEFERRRSRSRSRSRSPRSRKS